MPFKFNQELWNIGRKIEDDALPLLNKYFECDFKRNENDIWDILDFKDDEKKMIVEVKGRRISSRAYDETIITASKVTAGYKAIEEGYRIIFLFVFTDKTMYFELKEESSFKVTFTGTNCIEHYMIPVVDLKDLDDDPEKE